jgi:uncharacterized protein YbcI
MNPRESDRGIGGGPVSHPAEEGQRIEDTVSEEILRIHIESYGRGAARARTYILENDVVCFLDEIELLPNEEFLVDNGHADTVVNVRSKYQQAIEATFRAAVERATGRRVIGFSSHTSLEANFVCEMFRLAPADRDEPLKDP